MTKKDLFLKLAKPNKNGISRWVSVKEFVGEYLPLVFKNGWDWGRKGSSLEKMYNLEVHRDKTPGDRIDEIRLAGFNKSRAFNQSIRKDIREYYKDKNCVMLGIRGTSTNTKIEIDHKDGRKNDESVSNIQTQKIEDFQPLCKAANDVKRQICKNCKKTNKRWNAQNILGNPYPFYKGDENYTEELGCVGCYQYDPVEYRKTCVRRISKDATEYIMRKLFKEGGCQ